MRVGVIGFDTDADAVVRRDGAFERLLPLSHDGRPRNLFTVMERTARQLRQSEAWTNAVLTGVSDHAAGSLDARGIVKSWCVSAVGVLGFEGTAVIGQPYSVFYPDGAITPDRLLDRLREADRNGWSLDEGWRTCLEAAELEFERWQRSPRPVSLIPFDVDHFKQVNDNHGHAAGDAVLRHLAGLLAEACRQIDVAARVGGEEFAVLLPSTDLHDAQAIANRLRVAFETQAIDFDGVSIRGTVSGGVARVDASVHSVEALMKRADQALYAAKGGGRNRVELHSPD